MFKLGLTGSIGSGKSTVAAMLREMGAVVIDADRLALEAHTIGAPAYLETVALFGDSVVRPDGSLDRKAIGALVFQDETLKEQLERIVHPRVRDAQEALLANVRPGDIVVFDVPLLFERGGDRNMDRTCVVTVDDAQRFARLAERGMPREEAEARLRAQLPQAEKARRAHYTIDNSGPAEKTRRAVQEMMNELQTLATQAPS